MKTLSVKTTLAAAVTAALLGAAAVEAAPRVQLRVTAPRGSASTDANATAFFRSTNTVWAPCVSAGTTFGEVGAATTATSDSIAVNLNVTGLDPAEGQDLYVFFVNHSATGVDSGPNGPLYNENTGTTAAQDAILYDENGNIIIADTTSFPIPDNEVDVKEIKIWAARTNPFEASLRPYLIRLCHV